MANTHNPHGYKFNTLTIHGGQEVDPTTGAVIPILSMASTFAQRSPGEHTGYEYSRSGNPTRNTFERNLAAIEHGKYGLCFSSGLSATMTVISMLKSGDHVISGDDVYGGTNRYFQKVAANFGVTFEFVDMTKEGELEKALENPKTKLVWLETPTNPTLKIIDIKHAAEKSRNKNVWTVVDNTFASPYFQKPLDLGADIVLHSISKYINGHSDVIMGCIVTNNDELYTKLKFLQNAMGPIPSPFDCWLAMRGVKTLAIRMREHEKNAIAIAHFLEKHPKVKRVTFPGLASHPQHELAKRQMSGFGGMITFYLKGGLKESRQFLENTHLFILAESLGGVESLVEHPAIMTHASVPVEQRKILGIDDSLIRLSVGIEDLEDLLADLTHALDAVQLQD